MNEDVKVIITLSRSDDEVGITVGVDGDADFTTVLGLIEAAKIQYVNSKYLTVSHEVEA